MKAAQPLAVTTTAPAPASSSAVQASILRRASALASSGASRWKLTAPQQPARGLSASATPSFANTRLAAALNCGAAAACTQPASSTIRAPDPSRRSRCLARPRRERSPDLIRGPRPALGSLLFKPLGSAQANARPNASAAPNRPASLDTQRSSVRCTRSGHGRPTFASTNGRPTSSRRWYSTPDGQAVSQARHSRQRSRCSRRLGADRLALQRALHQVDAPARPIELVAGELEGGADGVAHAAVDAGARSPPRPGRRRWYRRAVRRPGARILRALRTCGRD